MSERVSVHCPKCGKHDFDVKFSLNLKEDYLEKTCECGYIEKIYPKSEWEHRLTKALHPFIDRVKTKEEAISLLEEVSTAMKLEKLDGYVRPSTPLKSSNHITKEIQGELADFKFGKMLGEELSDYAQGFKAALEWVLEIQSSKQTPKEAED